MAGSMLKLRGEGQPSRVQDNVGATLNPLAEAVGTTPIMDAAPPAWIRPDIISTSGYAQAPAPLCDTAYHRDALGYVHGKASLLTAAGAFQLVSAPAHFYETIFGRFLGLFPGYERPG